VVKDSLPCDEKAAKDLFFIGVFLDARLESELNHEADLVSLVPSRSGESFAYDGVSSFWF